MPETDSPTDTSRLPERLPVEDLDAGLYIHQHATPVTVLELPGPVDESRLRPGEPERRYLVSAEDFMAVQKERDDYRKVTALIGAWRLDPDRREETLIRLLESVGVTDGLASSVAEIVAQVRNGTF